MDPKSPLTYNIVVCEVYRKKNDIEPWNNDTQVCKRVLAVRTAAASFP